MKTRKNLIIVLGIILILVSGFICKDASQSSKNPQLLLTCFEYSKARPEESVLSGWTSIRGAFMNEQELRSKLDNIMEGLDLDESNTKKIIEAGGDMSKAALSSTKGSSSYSIVIESMRNNDKSEESYCFFTINHDGIYTNIMEDKMLAEKILDEAKLPMKLDALIIGSYKGKLAKKQGEFLVNRLLNNIEAHKVESLESDEIISVSAYSSQVGHHINSKGRKVNVQIAMRYSEYDDKTYLWLGSPVIHFEY